MNHKYFRPDDTGRHDRFVRTSHNRNYHWQFEEKRGITTEDALNGGSIILFILLVCFIYEAFK